MLRCRSVAALLAVPLAALAGCPGFGDGVPSTGALEPPTYAESVGALLEARCAACHSGEARVLPGFRLDRCADDEEALGARSMRGLIVEQTQAGTMPPDDPLSENEKALLASWAESGGACEPGYELHVRPVFTSYCTSCHGGGTPKDPSTPPTVRLDRCDTPADAEALGARDAADLIRIWLEDPFTPMPPAGEEPRPSDAEVARVLRWIDNGAHCDDVDDGGDASEGGS